MMAENEYGSLSSDKYFGKLIFIKKQVTPDLNLKV